MKFKVTVEWKRTSGTSGRSTLLLDVEGLDRLFQHIEYCTNRLGETSKVTVTTTK